MKRSRSRSRIEVRYQVQQGKILGFQVRGHAGFAPAGSDIVCAGVSALVLSIAYGLRQHAGAPTKIFDSPSEYSLSLRGGDGRSQALLQTLISGLKAIGRAYPGYLTVRLAPPASPGPSKGSAKAHVSRTGSTTE